MFKQLLKLFNPFSPPARIKTSTEAKKIRKEEVAYKRESRRIRLAYSKHGCKAHRRCYFWPYEKQMNPPRLMNRAARQTAM